MRLLKDPMCNEAGILHCTIVAYNKAITSTSIKFDSFFGPDCTHLKPLDNWSDPAGVKQGMVIGLAFGNDVPPSGSKCGKIIMTIGNSAVSDQFTLFSNSHGTIVDSNPHETEREIR